MAATRFFDSPTPISYSTLNTFGGLSRSLRALPSREPLHYAMLKATGLRIFSRSENGKIALNDHFGRNFLELYKSDFFLNR